MSRFSVIIKQVNREFFEAIAQILFDIYNEGNHDLLHFNASIKHGITLHHSINSD